MLRTSSQTKRKTRRGVVLTAALAVVSSTLYVLFPAIAPVISTFQHLQQQMPLGTDQEQPTEKK